MDNIIERKVKIFYWSVLIDKKLSIFCLEDFLNNINDISFYIFTSTHNDVIHFKINEKEYVLLMGDYLVYDSYYENFAIFHKLPKYIRKMQQIENLKNK